MSIQTYAQWFAAALGVLGGGKFIFEMLTVKSSNRKALAEGSKTAAEGSVILVDSASAYAQTLVNQMKELREDFDNYRDQQDRRNRQQDFLYRVHSRWDLSVQHQLQLLGVEVPEPPPLLSDAENF